MNEIVKHGLKLYVKTIFINIMCFFVVTSLISFSVAAFAEEVGYVAYGVKEGTTEEVKLYTHYNKDGEDKQFKEFEAQGYKINKKNIREVDKTGDTIILSVAQFFALGILISFIYPTIWDMAFSDSNLVKFEHKTKDKYKGLKIGAIATVPGFIFYLALMIGKGSYSKDLSTAIYKLANSAFYPIIELILNDKLYFKDLNILQIIILSLPVLAVPVTAHIAYCLGFEGFSLSEKLTYKKEK